VKPIGTYWNKGPLTEQWDDLKERVNESPSDHSCCRESNRSSSDDAAGRKNAERYRLGEFQALELYVTCQDPL
jgi:hypothetical protein